VEADDHVLSSTTGSRPFFVQLLKKMSEKRGEMTASKP
jgi:hypothetical protein